MQWSSIRSFLRLKFPSCNTSPRYNLLVEEISQTARNALSRYFTSVGFSNEEKTKSLESLRYHLRLHGIVGLDYVTLSVALKSCRYDSKIGSQIHCLAIKTGRDAFVSVCNSIMSTYCKSKQFDEAIFIFENMKNPDIVSWNVILSGFNRIEDAMKFIKQMQLLGDMFDATTYTTILSFFSNISEFLLLLQMHLMILKLGFVYDIFVGNALVSAYSRLGRLNQAEKLFDEMPNKDLVSWNALLCGCTQEGSSCLKAVEIFVEMVKEGFELDHISYSSAIVACGQEGILDLGKQIHGLTVRFGYHNHISVSNVLISMYSKSEFLEDAKLVFKNMIRRNVISWTTMISIDIENAVSLFNEMRIDGIEPNDVTFVGLIHSITIENLKNEGKMVHGISIKYGLVCEIHVCNSLITMYANFGSMEEAKRVFDEMECREVISWNSLISGYAQNSQSHEALVTFHSALLESKPNEFTFGSVLNAIAVSESVSIVHGQRSHSCVFKLGHISNPFVSSALLDMYAKRGNINASQKVFDEMSDRNLVSWTTIISAHSKHGNYESVMSLFKQMEKEKVFPDSITFLAVLSACNHRGMVDIGCQLFDMMTTRYMIEPTDEHYSCMVDMLGKSGRVKEAEDFMKKMPSGPTLSALQSLLGACSVHRTVEIGSRVTAMLMKLEPMESGPYVLASNMYAEKGDWEKVAEIRRGMRRKGVKKEVGLSWVDVGNADGSVHMHGFSSDDKSHPRINEICKVAENLGLELRYMLKEGLLFEEISL